MLTLKKAVVLMQSVFLLNCVLSPLYGAEEIENTSSARVKTSRKVTEEEAAPASTAKRLKQPAGSKVSASATAETVELVRGKGSKLTGGGPGGFYWKILNDGKQAGKVYINYTHEEPIGDHASIQIFLNKVSQGKHIGRFAYAKACEESSYDMVYAHMSKKNIASRKAAEAAGFKIVNMEGITQLLLKWVRKGR